MSKIKILFIFQDFQKLIESDNESYLKEPAKKFSLSIKKRLADLNFVYGMKKINLNIKIKEIKSNKDEIEIKVYEKDDNDKDNKIIYRVSGKDDKIQIFGELFVKNNKNNFKLILDNKNNREYELFAFYDLKKFSKYIINRTIEIKLKQINEVTDLSMMFQGCRDLISLPDLSKINIENVVDISYMFSNCSLLSSLPDLSSWDTSQVKNMSSLFYGCSSLTNLFDISFWDTSNVSDMSFLMYNCSSLMSLPDLSKWDTGEVTDMSYMFYNCSKLNTIPDISNWKITNLLKITNMFSGCSSLKQFPEISKWSQQIIINKDRINNQTDDIEKDIEEIQTFNDNYFVSCKNCKNIPEIILKDDESILLKCNKCCVSECENIGKISDYSSLWLNQIIHYCSNKHEENKKSRKYCQTCNLFLCYECLKQHKEKKNNHEYLEIKDLDFNLCEIHKIKISNYCKTCDKEICLKCKKDHEEHEVIDINDLYNEDESEKNVKESIKKIEEKKAEKDEEVKEKGDISDEIINLEEKDNNEIKENDDNNKNNENNEKLNKEKRINNKLLNLNTFEKSLIKIKELINEKDKKIKEILSFFEVLKEQDQSLQKAYSKYSKDFDDLLNKDQNFLILSKILFSSSKNKNNENISNYQEVIKILKNKFNNEEMEKFKDFIHSKREEFILCTQKLSENEKDKLKRNIDFQFKLPNKNISDSEKTKKFISKNIESTKIMRKHIIIQKIKDPDNYINIDKTLKNQSNIIKPFNSRENGAMVLSLFGKSIENNGVEVLVSRSKDKEFKNMEIAAVNSLITLGDKRSYEIYYDYGEEKNKQIINDEIEKEKIKYNFKIELSKKLHINKDEIILFIEPFEDIYEKKVILKYQFSIQNQTKDYTEEINEFVKGKNNIVKLNVKQVVDAIQISPELLDPQGDKYENWCKNKIRGGERYIPPKKDWYGIGLNVKNKYENNDWLDNKNKKGEFAIAYLGINTFLKDKKRILEDTKSFVDEISKMVSNKLYQFDSNMKVKGFCCEDCAPKCGAGVCLFQDPRYAENSAGIVEISGFKIKIILMCRVNPLKIRQPKKFRECWILNPTADEIRPYRILIKRIPCSSLHDNAITKSDSPIEYINKALESNDISFLSKKNDIRYKQYATIGKQIINDDYFVIRLYSSDYYKYINNYLRNQHYFENKNEKFEFTEKDIISWIFCLQLALLRNINVEEDRIVYRGIHKVKFSSDVGIGSKFYFREFISTSIKRSIAENFVNGEGTLLIIKIKNNGANGFPNYCYYIEDLTYFEGEEEILFCSHCFFTVTNIQHKKKVDYVSLVCEGYLLNNPKDIKAKSIASLK